MWWKTKEEEKILFLVEEIYRLNQLITLKNHALLRASLVIPAFVQEALNVQKEWGRGQKLCEHGLPEDFYCPLCHKENNASDSGTVS